MANRLDSIHLHCGESLLFSGLRLLEHVRGSIATYPAIYLAPVSAARNIY